MRREQEILSYKVEDSKVVNFKSIFIIITVFFLAALNLSALQQTTNQLVNTDTNNVRLTLAAYKSALLLDNLYVKGGEKDNDDKEASIKTTSTSLNKKTLADSINLLQKTLDQLLKSEQNPVKLSGFLDINYNPDHNDEEDDEESIKYGQFEIELSSSVTEKMAIQIAIGLEEGKFVPGTGLIHYHFFEAEEDHSAREQFLNSLGFHLGQFDVPFGIYYQYIPSPERNISTMPLVVEKTVNALNSIGFNLYVSHSLLDFTIYSLNGLDNSYLLGGRLGLNFFERLEVGLSYLGDYISLSQNNSKLIGFDLTAELSNFLITSEFISAEGVYQGEAVKSEAAHYGYYIECALSLEDWINLPLTLAIRQSEWIPDFSLDESGNAIEKQSIQDLSLSYAFLENLLFRAEYHHSSGLHNTKKSLITFQTVLQF